MRGRRGTQGFLTSRTGEVVAMYGLERGRESGDPFFVVADGQGGWADLSHFTNSEHDFIPLDRHEDGRIYVASNHDANTTGLFLFDPRTQSFGELLFRHPDVDIDGLVYSAGGGAVIGVSFTLDEPTVHYFNPGYAQSREELQTRLERNNVRFISIAREAGLALGLGKRQIFTRLILPQMWLLALPGLGNLFMILMKDTALVSVIGLEEIMRRSQIAVTASKEPFTFFLVAAFIYLGLTVIAMIGMHFLEKRAGRGFSRSAA